MVSIDIEQDNFVIMPRWVASEILPQNSLLINKTPFSLGSLSWPTFLKTCKKIQQQYLTTEFVFIDATWDPLHLDDTMIKNCLEQLKQIFNQSKVVLLSSKAQHFYTDIPNIIYVPLFAMRTYPELKFQKRSGRIGCLNRRNAMHRVLLMYTLIDQGLIDPQRDVYSVSFTNIFDHSFFNSSEFPELGKKIQSWPTTIQTHPDGFPNDYSINHPAWHTGISVITETEPGEYTLICEKTAKGILSKSCFTVYMADVGYRVLEDLGFAPRFFEQHAEYYNIEPILDICRTITTPDQAIDYRNQHLDQINYNFDWFGYNLPIDQRPWFSRYNQKLKDALNRL